MKTSWETEIDGYKIGVIVYLEINKPSVREVMFYNEPAGDGGRFAGGNGGYCSGDEMFIKK